MKKGYSVENVYFGSYDNCIIVDNYKHSNKILNVPININMVKNIKTIFTIGVWKIKNKN